MANLVKFMTGSANSFAALPTKDANTLYFLNDTKQLYKGAELYSKSFEVVSVLPSTGVVGVLYIETSTKKLHSWNGSAFVEALDASVVIDSEVTDASNNAVSAKAVYDFVAAEIAGLTGGSSNAFVTSILADNTAIGQFTVNKGTESSTVKVKLDGLAQAPSYDSTARKFTFPVVGGDAVEINLGKDLVVKSGTYDVDAQKIILTIDGEQESTIEIPVADLVDVYTASEDVTGAAKITISSNEIKAAVVVDDSTIHITDGKLVADFSTLVTKTVFEALETKVTNNETAITNLNTNLSKQITNLETRVGANETEITNIKAGYATKDLLTSNYYTRTEIDGQISTVNGAIGNMQTNLNNALTWVAIEG